MKHTISEPYLTSLVEVTTRENYSLLDLLRGNIIIIIIIRPDLGSQSALFHSWMKCYFSFLFMITQNTQY